MTEAYAWHNSVSEIRKGNVSRIVISGVGTGGHYFPAIVVAGEFVRRGIAVLFLVRKAYHEEKVARDHHLEVFEIKARGFFGTAIFHKVLAVMLICCSVYRLNSVTRKSVGIAFGGFGALPLILSCMVNRSPFYLFEPNRIPGRATRLFVNKARRVFLGLPTLQDIGRNTIVTGVPVRPGFKCIVPQRQDPTRNPVILFVGGSQGARKLNQLAIEMQQILPLNYRIVIVCGKRDFEWVNQRSDSRTRVIGFSQAIWEEFDLATVIVSRAGALAGYEIMASGKPVLFIPFPHAIDNHQYHNAEYFTRIGNAVVMREENMTANKLKESIFTLAKKKMSSPLLPLDAEKRIADTILKEIF